jgi:hypothetical protein
MLSDSSGPLDRSTITRMAGDLECSREGRGPFERESNLKLESEFYCRISCTDILGRKHPFEERYDIVETLNKVADVTFTTEVDALKQIADGIDDVNTELRDMNNDLL